MQGLMSELEAVNQMLAVSGDAPVQTLEDDYLQANLCRELLRRTSRKIQSKGWWFNEEENVTLSPNGFNKIVIPYNYAKATPKNVAGTVVQRGNELYDKENRTTVFELPVTVDAVIILDWDSLPQIAREYITDAACIQYNRERYGAQDIKNDLLMNLQSSLTEMNRTDLESREVNLINSSVRISNIAFKNRRG